MWLDQRSRIGTLRVRGAGADVPALRLAATGRLQTVDLGLPAEAPPTAILLVRRFTDPLPGRFPRRGPPAPDRDWERAAQAGLAEVYRTACRPRGGELPADAPAVVFRDEAELVAVAALHLARRGGEASWWWRALARFLPAAALTGVAPLLLAAPRQAAAALGELYRLRCEAPVLAALADGEAAAVLAAVAEAHGLPARANEVDRTANAAAGEKIGQEGAVTARRPGGEPGAVVRFDEPPWRAWLPASRTLALAPRLELLLAVAVGLGAAPAALRREGFWRRAEAWTRRREAAAAARRPRMAPAPDVGASPVSSGGPAPVRSESGARSVAGDEGTPPAARRRDRTWQRVSEIAPAAATDGDGGMTEDAAAPVPAVPPGVAALRRPALDAPADVRAADPDVPAEAPAAPRRAEAGADSGLGGVFYLVHVLERLDLPEACEGDWELASRLGAWGTLEALARALAGGDSETAADPLWRLLAELAGREPDALPSLAGDAAPAAFTAPGRWRTELGLAPAAGVFDPGLPLVAALDPNLRRWLAGAAPYAAAALLAALGASGRGPLEALLRLPCRVFATATHVDVVAGLGGISLPARRAGLDRDPGWVPRLGRVVQLHFR